MPAGKRANPLALAVLVCLAERPMHPYEVAQTLRSRHTADSVRLNYGSLYAVVDKLARRGQIEEAETERAGRLPERTIYRITEAGYAEMHDWLAELLAVPVKEYPAFGAALSFLAAVSPEEAVSLLAEREARLQAELAGVGDLRALATEWGLPRLFWVEAEYAGALRRTELDFVSRLRSDIASGALDGCSWWRRAYERPDATTSTSFTPMWESALGEEQP